MRHASWSLCPICRRQSRGYGWFDAHLSIGNPGRDQSYRQFCSRTCQDLYHRRRGMIDPTPNEKAAMQHGGAMGGEYLDSLGRTDLAVLAVEEWDSFVECIVTGYCDHLRDLAAKDQGRLQALGEGVPF